MDDGDLIGDNLGAGGGLFAASGQITLTHNHILSNTAMRAGANNLFFSTSTWGDGLGADEYWSDKLYLPVIWHDP